MEMKPLNIFQRCIRVWEEAHPYNAVQLLQVAGNADPAQITDTWNTILLAAGLGSVRVVGRHFRYEPVARQEVTVVDPALGLEAFITREMNRPFDQRTGTWRQRRFGDCLTMPFRPFLLAAPAANGSPPSYHLGIVYQHWVADSISIRMLLREWFRALHDPKSASSRALHIPAAGLWRYFGPARAGWTLGDGISGLLDSMSQFASARRIDEQAAASPHDVRCSLHRLPDGLVDPLLRAARRRGATLNDLALAALATASDAHGAPPRRSPRDLAMGTIVDLRAGSSENLDNTFSLFLGFTAVVIKSDLLRHRERLLAAIARQNLQHKERRSAQASMLRMAAGFAQGRILSPERLAAFYRTYMPLAAGVSNVNMNRSWPAEYFQSPLLDYIRVAPTGPMVPLVIAITTLGGKFTFVLTRRASLVGESHGQQLAHTFIEELTAFAKAG